MISKDIIVGNIGGAEARIEHHALKNVNKCFDTSFYSYIVTCGGQSSNLYLNVVHFFNNSVN